MLAHSFVSFLLARRTLYVPRSTMASRRERSIKNWHSFFTTCINRTLDFKLFKEAARKQASKSPLDSIGVLQAWAATHDNGFIVRPRLMKYFEQMLHLHFFSDADALKYVHSTFRETIESQDKYLVNSSEPKKEWKQTIEAAILERITYQMMNFRSATVAADDRVPDVRICKPLISLLAAFTDALKSSGEPVGPTWEIANELGGFVIAYINDLSLVGLLLCEAGGPPKGTAVYL